MSTNRRHIDFSGIFGAQSSLEPGIRSPLSQEGNFAAIYRVGSRWLVVQDVRYRCIKPDEIWIFGEPVTTIEKAIFEVVIPASCMLPIDRVHRIPTIPPQDPLRIDKSSLPDVERF